jgi:hypothetical protein
MKLQFKEKETMMTSGNHSTADASTVKQDRIASAILIGTGLLLLAGELLAGELDIVPDRLHLSLLHPWMEWWPLLFVVSGSILLVAARGARLLPVKSDSRAAQGEDQ